MRSGQRVGKYVLGEQIARGGMAEVWAARVEGPGGFVKSLALKFILESFAGDADLERLFVNEARVAAHLQHANLVSVFDFDTWTDPESGQAGRYYIAMERVDGQDLRRLLQMARHKSQKLPAALALHIAGEVLKGLRYVHERREDSGSRQLGLVHRDVSPHNVLVGMGGEVKLSDFGIAKAMSQSLGTQAGTIRGKLAYGSPEQLRGEAVDHRADQFALGITLWEMLAERRLFDGADEMEIVGKVLRCEIPRLPAAAEVDPGVEAVVGRMLAPAVGDRFPSTAEALAAVLALPGYVADGAPLSQLMQTLFGPRPILLPPTLPMKLNDPPGPGGMVETRALDRAEFEANFDAPMASATNADEVQEVGSGRGSWSAADRSGATASGYVSADSSSIPSWIESPQITARRRPRWAMMFALVSVAAAVALTVARRRELRPPTLPPVRQVSPNSRSVQSRVEHEASGPFNGPSRSGVPTYGDSRGERTLNTLTPLNDGGAGTDARELNSENKASPSPTNRGQKDDGPRIPSRRPSEKRVRPVPGILRLEGNKPDDEEGAQKSNASNGAPILD